MGTFRVTIEIGDPAGRHYETVEALVDTGATYTTVPVVKGTGHLLGRNCLISQGSVLDSSGAGV